MDSGDKALKYLGLIDELDDTSSTSLESESSHPPPQPLQREVLILLFCFNSSMVLR